MYYDLNYVKVYAALSAITHQRLKRSVLITYMYMYMYFIIIMLS